MPKCKLLDVRLFVATSSRDKDSRPFRMQHWKCISRWSQSKQTTTCMFIQQDKAELGLALTAQKITRYLFRKESQARSASFLLFEFISIFISAWTHSTFGWCSAMTHFNAIRLHWLRVSLPIPMYAFFPFFFHGYSISLAGFRCIFPIARWH